MPLFRFLRELGDGANDRQRQRKKRKMKFEGSYGEPDVDGSVTSLTRLCLLSLADNMKEVWVKDYADNYMEFYSFRYIMGPFSLLPGDLVEELTRLLSNRKQLSRAALHLLLVPQLRGLTLSRCPGLVTAALCTHISARCKGLRNLDLSGAQQLLSKVLSETLCCLPELRSLSLVGTPCDRCVIRTISLRCRFLRHLDVSCCHFLSPAALLHLGVGAPSSSSGSSSESSLCSTFPPLLRSLLALDIGFGEQEGEPAAAAAYLLLSLPCLERVAVDGLAQACSLIQQRRFDQTDEFTDREGVPRLGELWREWRHRQSMDSLGNKGDASADDEDEDGGRVSWEEYISESEEDADRDEGPSCSQNQEEEKGRGRDLPQSGDECVILHLKDVKGLSCDSLDSLSLLCPDIYSISVNVDDFKDARGRGQGSLSKGLQMWSGQLQSLSVHYSGALTDLLPALQAAGSSLLSLTLEGVKTSPHTPLWEVIEACPKLRDLLISAEPPAMPHEEHQRDDGDLPRLNNLRSLTLKFSYEHSQMRPVTTWMSLTRVLRSLLRGSLLLEKLSLVSLPCPLNSVLEDVLGRVDQNCYAYCKDFPPLPLGRLKHIELQRTDVMMSTVMSMMHRSKRLKYADVSHCWLINQPQWLRCSRLSRAEVVWE